MYRKINRIDSQMYRKINMIDCKDLNENFLNREKNLDF